MPAQSPTAPAWLTTLGIEDWKWERRLLESMLVEESDESYDLAHQHRIDQEAAGEKWTCKCRCCEWARAHSNGEGLGLAQ